MYIYRHREVRSHYVITDASQALGKLCLIGLETHQCVSRLQYKRTHRFGCHFTVILHISDMQFHILCQIWHQDSANREGSQKSKWKWMKYKE